MSAAAYAYSKHLCFNVKTYIYLAVLGLGLPSYLLLEIKLFLRRKNKL
jgi:hypothetical protein